MAISYTLPKRRYLAICFGARANLRITCDFYDQFFLGFTLINYKLILLSICIAHTSITRESHSLRTKIFYNSKN